MHLHPHSHLHKRQPVDQVVKRQFGDGLDDSDDPFQAIENGVNSLMNLGQPAPTHRAKDTGNSDAQIVNKKPDNGGEDGKPTFASIVYVTAAKTFSGPVLGHKTLTPAKVTPTVETETPQHHKPSSPAGITMEPAAHTTKHVEPSASSSHKAAATKSAARTQKTSLIDSIHVTSHTAAHTAAATPTATATASSNGTPAGTVAAASAASSSSSASASASKKDAGMSGGAKAGIAISIILVFVALAGAAFAVYRSKQNKAARETEEMSEKGPFGAAAAPPQSMNPVVAPTAFGALPVASAATASRDAQAANPANPFGQHAETISSTQAASGPVPTSTAEAEKAAMLAGAGAIAAAAIAKRHSNPRALDIKSAQQLPIASALAPASPSGSQFSNTSMTSSAIAGGAPVTNVHRIQLDFKPSMDDELGLKAGQLVRLLHEYDDGWALCIRLDRSQQGVAPRTCLSTRPVKPRNGPGSTSSIPPSMRPGQGRPGQSPGPALVDAPRSMSPALAPNQTQRSMSPGPYGGGPQQQRPAESRARSNSDNNMERMRGAAPGPSPMNPGQKVAVQGPTSPNVLPIQVPRPLTPSEPAPVTPVSRKPVPGSS